MPIRLFKQYHLQFAHCFKFSPKGCPMKTILISLLSIIMTSSTYAQNEPIIVNGKKFSISIPHTKIETRVQELGKQITNDYAEKKPIFIGVLNGAFMFLSDLVRAVNIDCEIDFMKISSYGNETESSGTIKLSQSVSRCIADRDVIIVEDIVETGNSIDFLLKHLQELNPRSIRIATLLHKNVSKLNFDIDYVGFNIAPEFVIGYGLDYAQEARNLKDIYSLVQ